MVSCGLIKELQQDETCRICGGDVDETNSFQGFISIQ